MSAFTESLWPIDSSGLDTNSEQSFSIKPNRISASASSLSIPVSSSNSLTIWLQVFISFSSSPSACTIIASFSASFVAAKRTGILAEFAWSSIKWIIEWIHLWTASSQKSTLSGNSQYFATLRACSISSSIPWFFAAEIGITGTPSSASKPFISMLPPLSATSSIMFKAITIGIFSSRSCIVKNKFLSIFAASTIFIIPSGFSWSIKSLVTISSLLYGESE